MKSAVAVVAISTIAFWWIPQAEPPATGEAHHEGIAPSGVGPSTDAQENPWADAYPDAAISSFHQSSWDDSLIEREALLTPKGSPYPVFISEIIATQADGSERVISRQEVVANEILLKPRPTTSSEKLAATLQEHGLSLDRSLGEHGWHVARWTRPARGDVEKIISKLEAYEDVFAHVESHAIHRVLTTPDDPLFSRQWPLQEPFTSSGLDRDGINAIAGWSQRTSAADTVVAIVDSGIALTHEDLKDNLWTNPGETGTDANGADKATNGIDDDNNGIVDDVHGANFYPGRIASDPNDTFGHGTNVAGIAGARGNNGVGIAGVAWEVQLMAVRCGDERFSSAALVEGIRYATQNGADIINCSLATPLEQQALLDQLTATRDAGVIVVCSAGNGSRNTDFSPYYPASYDLDNIIAVAAHTQTDFVASSSNIGSISTDIFAPGQNVRTTQIGSDPSSGSTGTYGIASGSSMAAAHVSGIMALLRSHFPDADHNTLINRLLVSARKKPWYLTRTKSGGQADLEAALTAAPETIGPLPQGVAPLSSQAVNEGESIELKVAVTDATDVTYQWYRNETLIEGATTTRLSIESIDADSDGDFRVEIRNAYGSTSLGAEILVHQSPSQNVVYVDHRAPLGGDGRSWESAYSDLTRALSRARAGSSIWVAQGTYKPTDDGDRRDSIRLRDKKHLYGGFKGDETEFHQRDPKKYPTILSGDVGVEGDASDNSYHVVSSSLDDSLEGGVIDGFHITGGNANGSFSSEIDGAGILQFSGLLTVRNCEFYDNIAQDDGGAIASIGSISTLNVSNSQFSKNRSGGNGAAIYGAFSQIYLHDSQFTQNWSGERGTVFVGSSNPTIQGSSFFQNQISQDGAGIYLISTTGATITDCVFALNNADRNGGAIYVNSRSSADLANCTFANNRARRGSGLYISSTSSGRSVTLENSIFWKNPALDSDGEQIKDLAEVAEGTVNFVGPGAKQASYAQNEDPLFYIEPTPGLDGEYGTADDILGDLRLQRNSPALDHPIATGAIGASDADGNPRTADGDGDGIDQIDLGAYEMQGPFGFWAKDQFGLNVVTPAFLIADPDNDNWSNLIEYALGLDPKTAETSGSLQRIHRSDTKIEFSYLQNPTLAGATFTVELSTDLQTWTAYAGELQASDYAPLSDIKEYRLTLDNAAPATPRFARLKISY